MIIREVYVNERVIARMNYVQNEEWHSVGKNKGETLLISYADILTTAGSQIQVKCTKEEYLCALNFLANKKTPIPEINLEERLDSILDSINEGLDEWQGVEAVHCPYELQSFKQAQEEIKEIIHDLEVSE